MTSPSRSAIVAAALVTASVGTGGWKVLEVRRENARLALQAKTCMARNEAFLAMLKAAAELRRTSVEGDP